MMVGENIRQARVAQDRSLAEIARRAKMSIATLSRIETDKQALDVGALVRLAQVLRVPPQDLLGAEAEADGDGNGSGTDPLVRRIAQLDPRERARLWRELSNASPNRSRRSDMALAEQIDELVAQVELLRQELDVVRKRLKKR